MLLEGVPGRDSILKAIPAHDTFMRVRDFKDGRILSVALTGTG
jgi:hypothetical protein